MKIVESDEKNLISFENIKVSQVFRCGGVIYMKIEAVDCMDEDECLETMRAVSLTTGGLRSFFNSDPVEPLNDARLILY